jgi:cephalosporin hydroxylase
MYKFTQDFNCGVGSYKNISDLIKTYGYPNTYIEVGVYEGSTIFWLADQLKKYNTKFFAIDPHTGSVDMSDDFSIVKNNFLYNLTESKNKNITYISKPSKHGLIDLLNQNVKAELIYIDGDHRAGEVLTDLVLSWELLVVGGIMLCDDTTTWKYKDKNNTYSAQMSPRMAVEMFIQCNWHKVEILNLPDGSQTGFRKTQE